MNTYVHKFTVFHNMNEFEGTPQEFAQNILDIQKSIQNGSVFEVARTPETPENKSVSASIDVEL